MADAAKTSEARDMQQQFSQKAFRLPAWRWQVASAAIADAAEFAKQQKQQRLSQEAKSVWVAGLAVASGQRSHCRRCEE
jgi:hypothetical protein